jgi:flagellar basal-body rod protein FlgC
MTFQQAIDHATGAGIVKPGRTVADTTPFRSIYDPSHPAADATGYVKLPNVSEMIEAGDGREAERSYEANLATLNQARSMFSKTLDILKV